MQVCGDKAVGAFGSGISVSIGEGEASELDRRTGWGDKAPDVYDLMLSSIM